MATKDMDKLVNHSRTFRNEKGNTDLCNPTGRELRESQDPADWWVEYEDSLGGLHYGR